ncbi:PDZ domain-containing protein [bacterium]|nr:MAG: PDZ domain-containing protein [bacterium]
MRALFTLLLMSLPVFFLAGCATQQLAGEGAPASPYFNLAELKEEQIIHVPTGRVVTEDELIDYLSRFRVIYIGEAHDSVNDHRIQLMAIQRLSRRFPGKVAVGMEMLRLPYQEAADQWVKGEIDEKEFLQKWTETWGQYEYYKDILAYARDAKIPLVALNREKPKKSMEAMMPAKAAEPPSGENAMAKAMSAEPSKAEVELDENDPYYNAYIGAFFVGHGDGKPEIGKMFLRGQMLWDETMADTAAKYLSANPDHKLIVLAGGNHVRYGFGIPRRVFRRVPEPFAIVDPWIVEFPEDKLDRLMDVSPPPLPLPIADFVWGVAYKDLEGQKAMLGVGIEDSEEPKGVRIRSVMELSPASKAGLLKDDVITAVDGAEVKVLFDLTFEMTKKAIGQAGEVKVIREGKELTVPVTFDKVEHKKAEKKP